jgi:hypothetical protein
MRQPITLYLLLFSTLFFQKQLSAQGCFPVDKLPNYITPLTNFGQRAEWSLDGKNVYFLDKPGGDVWVIHLKSKKKRQVTKPQDRPQGHGYYRVACLANGDLLLGCGAERHQLYFQILDKKLRQSPQKIEGEALDEGPATSRKTMKIAWTLPEQKQIYWGFIQYDKGKPFISGKKLLVDFKNVVSDEGIRYEDILESQNWRFDDESELIFAQYRRGESFRCEVMGIHVQTGKIINYSKDSLAYDEPEGIFPDHKSTLVESDKHLLSKSTSTIDIYRLQLDGTGKNYERLTHFTDVKGYRSSNPVVSNDARYMVFQGSIAGSDAGAGCGLYLFDFQGFKKNKAAKK